MSKDKDEFLETLLNICPPGVIAVAIVATGYKVIKGLLSESEEQTDNQDDKENKQ